MDKRFIVQNCIFCGFLLVFFIIVIVLIITHPVETKTVNAIESSSQDDIGYAESGSSDAYGEITDEYISRYLY